MEHKPELIYKSIGNYCLQKIAVFIGIRVNWMYDQLCINKNVLSEENIKRKIDSLLKELQEKTGVSDEEMDEFKKIMDLAYFSQEQE